MKETYYIYHNPCLELNYAINDLKKIIDYTSNITLSLCTSFLNVENFDNLIYVSHNGTGSIITDNIYYNELTNENSGGRINNTYNSAKYEFIQNILRRKTKYSSLPPGLTSQTQRIK